MVLGHGTRPIGSVSKFRAIWRWWYVRRSIWVHFVPKWTFDKNREVLISSRKRFSQKRTFYCVKTTNRPDQNDRKKRAKISWFHQKLSKTSVFTSETYVFHENHDFQFCL